MKQQTKTDKVKDQTKKNGEEVPKTPAEKKQQQSDPQITELKGFIDPQEELEVKGTDNPYWLPKNSSERILRIDHRLAWW